MFTCPTVLAYCAKHRTLYVQYDANYCLKKKLDKKEKDAAKRTNAGLVGIIYLPTMLPQITRLSEAYEANEGRKKRARVSYTAIRENKPELKNTPQAQDGTHTHTLTHSLSCKACAVMPS